MSWQRAITKPESGDSQLPTAIPLSLELYCPQRHIRVKSWLDSNGQESLRGLGTRGGCIYILYLPNLKARESSVRR